MVDQQLMLDSICETGGHSRQLQRALYRMTEQKVYLLATVTERLSSELCQLVASLTCLLMLLDERLRSLQLTNVLLH